MPTGSEYAAKAREVYNHKPQVGYIYGTAFVDWTKAKQDALVKKYNSDPKKYANYKLSAEKGSKWIGHKVTDCSGLTKKLGADLGLSYYHGSNSSWKYDCQVKGELTPGLKLPEGAFVYTGTNTDKPHIGIVSDDTWVVEAQGTNAGVTRTKITNSKWKYWGLGKGLTFDFIPGNANPVVNPEKPTTPTVKIPSTIRRGARGDLVKRLQRILVKNGSTIVIDGIFGPGTQSAVRSFQSRHNLVVDGIVGPKTWSELLKLE